jgi:hypothetical protein
MASNADVLVLLAMLAEQSGETVSPQRIDFTGQRLLALARPDVVAAALTKLLESARRFPTVAEVRAEMGMSDPTAKDEALMISNAICTALIRFGWLQPGYELGARAREAVVGPGAWHVLKHVGGWNAALDRLGENETALRAQLRDLAEAYLKTGAIERGQLPPHNPPSPVEAIEMLKKETPQLEEYRSGERKNKIGAELEEMRKKRQLALMQEEHDKARRLPDPETEEPPF